MRNAPDVPIVATDISLYWNGNWNGFVVTSAAAPLWTGFIALVNQAAAQRARPRIGSPTRDLRARPESLRSCVHGEGRT